MDDEQKNNNNLKPDKKSTYNICKTLIISNCSKLWERGRERGERKEWERTVKKCNDGTSLL